MVENFNQSLEDKKAIKEQLGDRDSYILIINRWLPEQLTTYDFSLKIEYRTLGDSFILGVSRLGTGRLGSSGVGNWTEHQDNTDTQKITKAGIQEIREWFYDDSGTAPTHLVYGTGTTDFNENQTALTTEAGSRVSLASYGAITITSAVPSIVQYVVTFVADSTVASTTEWGLFNASSSGNMYCRRKMTAITLTADTYQYRVTWILKVNDL